MTTTVIVPSTTHYSDAWGPFVALFRKFWPDCPYKLVLITDFKSDPWDGDDAIVIGRDYGWCKNLVRGLNEIKSDHVIMLQEDFFLNAPTDTAYIQKALEMTIDKNLACFRLYPCPGPDWPLGDDYGLISVGKPYRVSCQAAIWSREELYEIAGHPQINSPREFEIDGTNFVNSEHTVCQYYSVKRDPNQWPLQYYCSAITRGEWNPDAVTFVKSLGIPINNSRRPTQRVIT